MDFYEVLQKAIDKAKFETGIVEPEQIFIDGVSFNKTEYTKLRECSYMMDHFDVVADLKRCGLEIAGDLLPKNVNGYPVKYLLEFEPSEFGYQCILNVRVITYLFCNSSNKPTDFNVRHVFDISDAKRSDGSRNESFYNYIRSSYSDIFKNVLCTVCRFANTALRKEI